MSIVLLGSTSGSITLQEPAVAGTNTLNLPAVTGTLVVAGQNSAITADTAKTATSTSVDFTGIPSWVKRITVMYSGVSTNSTSALLVQIGSSGTPVNTGYVGSVAGINAGTTATATLSAGFNLNRTTVAADNYQGNIVITNLTGNTWTASWTSSNQTTITTVGAGQIALSGTLNIVRFTSVTPDTFDAGTINILYE